MVECRGFPWLRGCRGVSSRFDILLGTDTILWHHVTGSPLGTGSKTPSLTSLWHHVTGPPLGTGSKTPSLTSLWHHVTGPSLGTGSKTPSLTSLWHHVTGSPLGTGSMTPSLTSLSSPALTSSCQCNGTGMGEWWAVVVALGSIISFMGGPSIKIRI